MQRSAGSAQPSGSGITVRVGRFGERPRDYTLSTGATVAQALEAAGIALAGETVVVNGEKDINMEDILEDGDVLNLVTSKEAGV